MTVMRASTPEDLRPGADASYRDAVKGYRLMARMGSVNDVADAAGYFASDLASFVSGQHLLRSGGADR